MNKKVTGVSALLALSVMTVGLAYAYNPYDLKISSADSSGSTVSDSYITPTGNGPNLLMWDPVNHVNKFADVDATWFNMNGGKLGINPIMATMYSDGMMASTTFLRIQNLANVADSGDYLQLINRPVCATQSQRGLFCITDKTKLDNLPSVAISGSYNDLTDKPTIPTIVVSKKLFKTTVAGGSGNAVFYVTDTGTASGMALYSSLTADDLIVSFDGVTDQYAPTITVASDKKSVTVNMKRQNFSSSNVLLNLLGTVTQALTGVTYVNATDGLAVKLFVGIDD